MTRGSVWVWVTKQNLRLCRFYKAPNIKESFFVRNMYFSIGFFSVCIRASTNPKSQVNDSLAPAVTGLVSEMRELPGPVRQLASLTLEEPERSDGILKATDELLNAVSKLLNSAQGDEDASILSKKRAIQLAATSVSTALEDVLSFVKEGCYF